jgi:hypothetical protein
VRCVSECDREASTRRRPWDTRDCYAMERRDTYYLVILLVIIFNLLAPGCKLLHSDRVGKVWRSQWPTDSS